MWLWHWSFELKHSIKYLMPGSTVLHLAILFYPFFLLKINPNPTKTYLMLVFFMIYLTRTTNLSDLKTVFRSIFFQIWPRIKFLNFLAGLDCSYLPAQNVFWQVQENQYPIVNPIQSSFYRKEHSQSVSVGVSPNKGRTPPVIKVNVSEPLRWRIKDDQVFWDRRQLHCGFTSPTVRSWITTSSAVNTFLLWTTRESAAKSDNKRPWFCNFLTRLLSISKQLTMFQRETTSDKSIVLWGPLCFRWGLLRKLTKETLGLCF